MTLRLVSSGLGLAAAIGIVACNAGEISVFSSAAAGTGNMSGTDSTGGGDTGGGGVSAGQGGDFSAGGGGGVVCHSNSDCGDTSLFCFKQSCGPGAPGVCVVREVVCERQRGLVCGCDHITYWNECFRKEYGISASTPGACDVGAKNCHNNGECFGDATCARLVLPLAQGGVALPQNTTCGGVSGTGTCWVVPSDCSNSGDADVWQSCPPPGPMGGASGASGASGTGGTGATGGTEPVVPCMSTCQAIRAGHPAIRLDPGATCQ